MSLPGTHRNPALLCAALAILAVGCRTPDGAPPKVEEIQWITRDFADGQVTMDLPGKPNRDLRRASGLVYGRLLEKQWITFTVGSYSISEVEVYTGNPSDSPYTWDFVQSEMGRVRQEHPDPAGQIFVEEWGGAGLGFSKFRKAVVVLPDGKRGVLLVFRTCPTSWDPEKYHHRFAIDDEIFVRIVDSVRLDGVIPPRKRFGKRNESLGADQ